MSQYIKAFFLIFFNQSDSSYQSHFIASWPTGIKLTKTMICFLANYKASCITCSAEVNRFCQKSSQKSFIDGSPGNKAEIENWHALLLYTIRGVIVLLTSWLTIMWRFKKHGFIWSTGLEHYLQHFWKCAQLHMLGNLAVCRMQVKKLDLNVRLSARVSHHFYASY